MSPSEPSAMAFVGPFLSTCALIIGMVGTFACQFNSVGITLPGGGTTSLGLGIWNIQGWYYITDGSNVYYTETCNSYDDSISQDPYWKTAQAFSIIATVFGGVACIASCIVSCSEACVIGNKVLAFAFMFTALCQGLCLLFLQSDACDIADLDPAFDGTSFSCDLSWGASCTIAATVLWFVAGASMCFMSKKESKADDEYVEADEDEEQAEGKDDAPK